MADRRFIADDGTEWASRYEHRVYTELRRILGDRVRKCGQGDSIAYTTTVKAGSCLECGSSRVVQQRTYTPDMWVGPAHGRDASEGYFIESKGFWNAHKRNLLRAAARCNPDLNLVLVFQNDGWVTKGKSRYSDYCMRYLKGVPVVIWKDFLKHPPDLGQLLYEARHESEEG